MNRRPRSTSLASATPTPAAPGGRKRGREALPEPPKNPFPELPLQLHPSEYLRRRCPACFANLKHDPTAEADIFPCIDACFTQKKKKSAQDPVKKHPDLLFIPKQQTAQTEEYVDGVCGTSGKKERPRKRGVGMHMLDEDEDGYEYEDLLLPCSVLDGCEASFTAANKKREKASTNFFEDTALMALVWRHDRVLFLVNMHSAGEKQFYVIALVETLFQHIPHHIVVGLLYDVTCSAERNCCPSSMLSGMSGRVSCWAERFWNSIRHLIAHLRIYGYHNCLYTLDAQIIHHQEASLFRLGDWICWRYHHCLKKRTNATKDLHKSGKPVAFLQEQWKLQRAVNAVVLLCLSMKARQELRHELREKYLRAVEDGDEAATMYEQEFREAEEALTKVQVNLRRKEAALGVTEHVELLELVKSEYMHLRMNVHALKLRLYEQLRARKFEMDVVSGEAPRTDDHQIAAEYNKLCGQLAKLIKDGKTPAGSTAPLPIPPKGPEPRLWLCDEHMRVGIKGMLQLDRCDEEDARLWRETMALQVWFGEEWQLSREVIERAESAVNKYHLQMHQDKLVHLCATWDKHLPDFGPEKKALLTPVVSEPIEDWHYGIDNDEEDEEDEYDEGSGSEEEDLRLWMRWSGRTFTIMTNRIIIS
ncbi:hypothetical protein B0H14DRAFT_3527804 [Mycena olivaceomarginata]|nr:hypothetical protein B0H14DRAFT_3527804 [Mycena olivaceomarginata]